MANRAKRLSACLAGATCVALCGLCAPAGAVTFTMYTQGTTEPTAITAGHDGNMWFTDSNSIGKITPDGTVTEFPEDSSDTPQGITAGPDGNVWFTNMRGNSVGKITPDGTITEFPSATSTTTLAQPNGITAGPDGNVWFSDQGHTELAKITPDGTITEFGGPPNLSIPEYIAAGSDGNMWFTEPAVSEIGRLTPGGLITLFPVGTPNKNGPIKIISGINGNVWFTDDAIGEVGEMAPDGTVAEFADNVPRPLLPDGTQNPNGGGFDTGRPSDIAVGADGNMWFVDPGALVRLNPDGTTLRFTLPATDTNPEGLSPRGLAAGPNGTLWVTGRDTIAKVSDLSDVTTAAQPGSSTPAAPVIVGATPSAVASHVTFAPNHFRAAPSGASASAARRRYGSLVSFAVSQPASVRFTVTHHVTGRRAASGTCVTATRHSRHARPCTRTLTLSGHFTRTGAAGRNSFHFSGRLNGARLKPGAYVLVATPATKGGQPSSAPFTIIR